MSGLFLTPSAGAGADHSSLVAIEEAVAPMPVARVDFPYRKEGRAFPDRAPKLIAHIESESAAFAQANKLDAKDLILGGRSMGGRMCSMAVAEGMPAKALVLVCYPLHPPKKPEKLRIEHLPDITVPCLFVSGTKDEFGTPDELTKATSAIPGDVTHHWIEGKRHSLKGADDEIAQVVAEWIRGLD